MLLRPDDRVKYGMRAHGRHAIDTRSTSILAGWLGTVGEDAAVSATMSLAGAGHPGGIDAWQA